VIIVAAGGIGMVALSGPWVDLAETWHGSLRAVHSIVGMAGA